MAKTLIKGGTIVTAADTYQGDVLVEDEEVALLGRHLDQQVDRVIDATGRYVIPGGVDPHVHFDMFFCGTVTADDFETGTRAAACGGTTTIIDFAIQDAGGTLRQAWETWMGKAEGKAVIDYGFHLIMREFNDALGKEMEEMVREGIPSFKLFTAYPGVFMLDDGTMLRAMQRSGEIGASISVHAENGWAINVLIEQARAKGHLEPRWHALTRPARLEAEATHRCIVLAELAGVPLYVVHLTAAEALEHVIAARQRGVEVYAETCPQYLLLDHRNYEEPGFNGAKYVMSPPLRDRARQDELWRAIANHDIHVVGTDHCSFNMEGQKPMGQDDFSKIPNGLPAVENRVVLMHDGGPVAGRFSINRWVEVTSTAPAKLFGLYPRKGTIAPGSDADLVVFNPEAEQVISAKTHMMNVDYNPYEGRRVKGVCETVLSRGTVIVDQGKFVGQKGAGRFLRRAPRS